MTVSVGTMPQYSYIVCHGDTASNLALEVQRQHAMGFRCVGGVSVALYRRITADDRLYLAPSPGTVWAQAMESTA